MKRILILSLMALFSLKSYAQDTGSGMDFLNIGPSSRLLSLSEATTATLTGPSSIYTNPSLLAFEPISSIDLNYTLWISNVNNQFAAVNFRRERSAIAFGVYSSQADDFEARDLPGPPSGNFSISYLSLSAALAHRIGPLAVGGTVQYLREEVFQFIANGYGFTLGASAEFFQRRVRAGVSVNNMGNMESLDVVSTPVPSTINVGLSAGFIEFTTPGLNDLPVLITLHTDWSKPLKELGTSDFTERDADEGFLSFALSADIAELFSIQGGYRFGPTERPVSFGLGMIIEPVRVNYALVPFSTGFGTVHSFGIEYYF